MKRMVLYLLAVCLLAGVVTLTAPQAKAAEHTDHCVCGGSAEGVGGHACETVQWQPLSGVVTLNAVDFKNVPSGYYYLDGDVTVTAVTDGYSIGSAVKNDDGVTYTTEAQQISLCLNGHTITTKKDRVFKGVYTGSTLNICDCSGQCVDGVWQWEGKIVGGTSNNGGITYTYANSTTNIYGGNLTNTNTTGSGGGLFYVAQDRAAVGNTVGQASADYASTMNIYNGNFYGGTATKNGGNFYVAHYSKLNVYGGYIHDGTAGTRGGNIYYGGNCTVNLSNAVIYNGTATTYGNIYPIKTIDFTANAIYGGYPEAVHVATVQDGKETLSQGYTLADALVQLTDDSYLKLTRDLTEETEISGTVYLDMNGCDLSGVTVTGTLYGFDSTTDAYEGANAGTLTCTAADGAQVVSDHKTQEALVGSIKRYLTVPGENGSYSFHRFYIGLTKVTLRPDSAGMGYKAVFAGDQAVANYLSGTQAYGYQLWIREDIKRTRGYSADKFGGLQEVTLGLNNILSTNNDTETNLANADTRIHAVAFVQLKDGRTITSAQYSYTFKEMIHLADASYSGYNTAQQSALQNMSAKFSETLMTWDIPNTHHADGGIWQQVDDLNDVLTKSGSYYNVAQGAYVLTEDVDIGSKTMKIASGTTVNICLNGHTITGSQRMMRIYGTLNLCDCHAHGEAEGGMTSSFTADEGHGAVFYTYYGSVFNLYGGNLKATGTLKTSGVGAVSHENQDDYPDIAPGVMNMYGGTISGGKVSSYGGLITVFHSATFNMYGGELYGGYAQNHGGAINAGNGCNVNLFGGSIYDCSTDGSGGALYLTGTAERYIGKDMTIRDNTAQGTGGNIYLETNSPLSIDGSVVTGGDIYVHGGQLSLSGTVDISDLYMNYASALNADAMTADSRVGFDADVYGFLTNNTDLTDSFVLRNADYEVKEVFGKLLAVEPGLEVKVQTEDFRVGHGSVCIDPAVTEGIPLSGFGNSAARLSTGVQESLYASATAITDAEDNTVLLITCDLQRPQEAITDVIREQISRATGVPFNNVILSASHSHSTPDLYSGNDLIAAYKLKLYNDFTQAAIQAMASRVSSNVETGGLDEVITADGKHMNFTRHYYYYDENGVKQYCGDNFGTAPASGDRTADKFFHVAEGDHSLQLIRFDRGEEKDVVLCNWAAHPTMTGGSDKYVISADYVGPLRDKVQAETDCYFSFVQGAAGNMNTTSRITGETPYTKAQYHDYGEALADFVIAGLSDMQSVPAGLVQTEQYVYEATVYKHSDEEVERAKALNALTYEERKEKYAEYGFTSIYHASSVISKSNLGDTQALELNVFSIGDSLGFYSLPGELWAESALKVKEASGFASTFTVGYTNGDWKYFPDGDAADLSAENGYENYEYFYSRFVLPDTTQSMIEYWQDALARLYENAK